MASAPQDDDVITGINVTPLVDISLVLLIIFMMTASYIVTPAIRVELPKSSTAETVVQSTLVLVLTKEGSLYLNHEKVSEPDLRAFIRAEKAKNKDLEAVIAADASVTHGQVVHVIDVIKSEGVIRFALNTDSTESPVPASTPPSPEDHPGH